MVIGNLHLTVNVIYVLLFLKGSLFLAGPGDSIKTIRKIDSINYISTKNEDLLQEIYFYFSNNEV
jgi:hypothetical protein